MVTSVDVESGWHDYCDSKDIDSRTCASKCRYFYASLCGKFVLDNSRDMYPTWDAYNRTKILVHALQLDEKAGKSSSVDSIVDHLEMRYDWLDPKIKNSRIPTLILNWWRVLNQARQGFPDDTLWWRFFYVA